MNTTITRFVKILVKAATRLNTVTLQNRIKEITATFFGRTLARECCRSNTRSVFKCYIILSNSIIKSIYLQGCFLNNIGCYNQSKCIGQKEEPRKNLLFCCCEGDYCNHEFSWEPLSTDTPHLTGNHMQSSYVLSSTSFICFLALHRGCTNTEKYPRKTSFEHIDVHACPDFSHHFHGSCRLLDVQTPTHGIFQWGRNWTV